MGTDRITLQHLLDHVEICDLPVRRKRDIISAILRTSEMFSRTPRDVPLDELRSLLREIRPAAHGISRKSFSNIRSLLASALAQVGRLDPSLRGLAKNHPGWGGLIRLLAGDKELLAGLAAFANWCAFKDIAPEQVTDAAVQEFHAWLNNRTLCLNPNELTRRIPKLWLKASDSIDNWPKTSLAPLTFKILSNRLSWTDLPESFRRDANAYLEMRRQPDVFAESTILPSRPLAGSTLRQHQEHLRLAASILVTETGIPVVDMTSLSQLTEVEAFKAVLRYYLGKKAGEASSFASSLAMTLIQVAKFYVVADDEHIKRLRGLANRLPQVPFDLTEKNKLLIRQLESKKARSALLFLPERLLKEVARDLKGGSCRFVDAQCAIAIDILLCVPLRPQNLSALHWQRHFQEVDTSRSLLLHIPAAETKTKKMDIIAEIPEDVARRISWYRNHVLPHLGGDRNGHLFVVREGALKHQKTLAGQVIAVIARHVGVHMTPHQFRHFAAVAYLEEHPEDFETARALLGHAFGKTTRVYAGSSTRRAGRAYGRFLFKTKNELARAT